VNHPPLRPKKSLGQNFLRDENIARKIVAAVAPLRSDVVVEIGPGEGALTKYLVNAVRRLVVVDVDERVTRRLSGQFPAEQLQVVHADFLETDLAALSSAAGSRLRVVGNIPYNITSPILFHLLDHRMQIQDVTMMMQREVARRLVAGPHTREYGILSVFTQLFSDATLLFDVRPTVFYPRPDVTSSVVQLRMRPTPRYALRDEAAFRRMVRAVFGKRRKMLRNTLREFVEQEGRCMPSGFDLEKRPEDLTVAQLAALSNAI
jgi:16S rRNA (adenine1518-N6/adenine1519-N6)-dimethyltransferase